MIAIILIFSLGSLSAVQARGVNGGVICATCTIVFGITNQLAEIHSESLLAASLRFCHMIPNPLGLYCAEAVQILEPILTNQNLSLFFTPDVMCYGIGLCYIEHHYCHLFPRSQSNFDHVVQDVKGLARGVNVKFVKYFDRVQYTLCQLPGLRQLCKLLAENWINMEPTVDFDDDTFSIFQTARGSYWRGRDCEDSNVNVHPGRQPHNGDEFVDHNCNGIWGRNPVSGQLFEDELCGQSGSRGLIAVGDSVFAHFHFPEVWMNPLLISQESLHKYVLPLLDELDWPHLGFATGYMNSTEPLLIKGATDSIYLRLRNRNRCNHRDYQNICRNGASSVELVRYIRNVVRNKTISKPAVVLYGTFGNDVCNNFPDTVKHMTTPEQFRSNVWKILNYLNEILPIGSHVVMVGIADGGFIYPAMANRLHPLGLLRSDVYYHNVYEWFTCMEIGPCVGWMTPNATLRHITSQRASELSCKLKQLARTEHFSNFELHYLENPLPEVFRKWEAQGKFLWQLVDPIDSLHPNQEAQPLLAEVMWEGIMQKFPHVFGDENPNNIFIKELFGEQGGH